MFLNQAQFAESGKFSGVDDSGNGGGGAWADYDGDGDLDLFLSQVGAANILYRNNGNSTFTDQTSTAGLGTGGHTQAWADYDNDGDLDVYVGQNGANYLYQNNGSGVFSDVTTASGTAEGNSNDGVTWADYDNDGDVDLYLVQNGANVLFSNDGDATFTDATSTAGVGQASNGRSAVWGDADGDGDLDLYVANTSAANVFYTNDGDATFTDASASPVNDSGDGFGAAWGDYDNDNDLDIYLAHNSSGTNRLFKNNGSGTFTEVGSSASVADTGNNTAAAWGDYDNDGDLDLFVGNQSASSLLYSNDGDGTFTESATTAGTSDSQQGRGAAWGDFDADGDLDLYVVNGTGGSGSVNRLYRNNGNSNKYLHVKLTGAANNKSAIGTTVIAVTGSTRQTRVVGSGGMYFSQDSLPIEFGFGTTATVDSLIVKWPAGFQTVQTSVSTNQTVTVTEASETFTEVGSSAGVADAQSGQGASWGDFDADGDQDLYVGNQTGGTGSTDRLYRNNGNGTFTDIASSAGTNYTGSTRTPVWGDYDGDGDLDVYLSISGADVLYRNNGNSTFTNVASSAGVDVTGTQDGFGASWADYDNDGDLDLYAASWSGTNNRFYQNDGDGTFTEVGSSTGVNDSGAGLGIAWADADGDGDLDLYVAKVSVANLLYRNNSNGTFTDIASSAGVAETSDTRGVAWADYDRDGDLDFYISNGNANNRLYQNNGSGSFTNVAAAAGVANLAVGIGWAGSVGWADYDNDGDLDFYMTGGSSPNRLYRNNGSGVFEDVGLGAGVNASGFSSGGAWADYDNDGDMDLYVNVLGSANRLYRNGGNSNKWLQVKLAGTGSNKSAIGAVVTAVTGSSRQRLNVDGGSGYLSQPSIPVEFGFGSTSTVDSLLITWPSGVDTFLTSVSTNQTLSLTELPPFTDVAASAGVNNSGSGTGTAWGDYDGDGDLDLYLSRTGGAANILYRNNGNGTFTDVSVSPTNDANSGTGVTWADYDNDGDLDLHLCNYAQSNKLFRNDGGGTFTDVTAAPLNDTNGSLAAAWADYDHDGDLDLYLANDFAANKLFANDGDGTFTDVSAAPINDGNSGRGVAWADYDGDGDLDLYVAMLSSANKLFSNDGDGTFTDVSASPINDGNSARGVAWADYDNDGDLDLYLGVYDAANGLYRNNGNGTFTDATSAPINDASATQGVAWADYDNDGDLDLYVANKDVANKFFSNDGDGTFTDVTTTPLNNTKNSVGLSWGDYDGDGDLDLFVPNDAAANLLLRNEVGASKKWLQVKLTGTANYKSAIATTVTAVTGSTRQRRDVDGGSGYESQPSLPLEFGFGTTATIDSLIVDWHAGFQTVQTSVSTNQTLSITEPAATFTDVASSLGVAQTGRGFAGAWGDYDGDGDLDLYVANQNSEANLLYRNDTSSFAEVASSAGVDGGSVTSASLAWADYDNDGDLDLYVGNESAANKLFQNNGNGTFSDASTGVNNASIARGVAWADYDSDGDVDLYVANSGAVNLLYRNDNGSFAEVASTAGVNNNAPDWGVAWGDYDKDSDLDLIVVISGGTSRLYSNDGDGTFTDVATSAGVNDNGGYTSVAWADYDVDGDLDFYLGGHNTANKLYRNNGNNTFTDLASSAGVAQVGKARGIGWADYDNDGDLDIYLANADQPNQLYENNGSGIFNDVVVGAGVQDLNTSYGISWGDYDGDGDLDIYLTNDGEANRLFRNNGNSNKWLQVKLTGEGTASNKSAIGTKVTAVTGSTRQQRDVDGGSGLFSQPSLPLEFGFGSTATIDSLLIAWPSGVDTFLTTVSTNQALSITELPPFTDVAASAGVDNSGVGAGAAWADYDSDGDLDLYLVKDNAAHVLYRNNGNATFTDVATSPISDSNTGPGVAWADYDNDGDLDIYLANYGNSNKLYRNDGGGTFANVTASPVDDTGNNTSVSWVDYDSDGDVDLYTTNGSTANKLFSNDGDGTFTDVSASPINASSMFGAAWGDYDNDGDLDVYLSNDSGANKLISNDGDGTFTDVSAAPVNDANNGRGAAWGDYNNDGDLDLYQANRSSVANELYRNNGDGTFTDVSAAPVNDANNGAGVGWADYDNDGDLDLYLANSSQANKLFSNDGDGTFTDVTTTPLNNTGNADGVTWGDYDGDGDLDIYVVNNPEANVLFRNEVGASKKWLQVKLTGGATASNTAAIGAKVTAVTGSTRQQRVVDGGSGLFSQPSLPLEFGFGTTASVDSLLITWPSGIDTFLTSVSTNQTLSMTELPEFTNVASLAGVGDTGNGQGTAWGDYDGDGDLDLYAMNTAANKLYRNNGNGTFTDASASPVNIGGAGMAWGDYDNDGDLDLYMTRDSQTNKLFSNDGDGTFTDASAAPLNDSGSARSTAWGDYDNDGDLDLYLVNSGTANALYRNDGDGTFTDASASPVNDSGSGKTGIWGDYDNDGDLDLYVSNTGTSNKLFRNDGNGTFIDATAAPVNDSGSGVGTAWGDYDNDGDLDLYESHTGGEANKLFSNDGDGTFTDATAAPLNDTGNGFGVAWADYDNDGDGDADLYVANDNTANRLYRNNGNKTFTEIGSTANVADTGPGRGIAFADYDNDGDLDLYVLNTGSANRLYRNGGSGSFSEVGSTAGVADSGNGWGVAWNDYDKDGSVDLYVARDGVANLLYRNNGDGTLADVASTANVADTGAGRIAAWGDVDNDGDTDLYVANSGANKLYVNGGSGSFTDGSTGVNDANTGLGVGFADYDNDGDLDLYVANNDAANRLYRNGGSGSFSEVGSAAGVANASASVGVAWGDTDNDGDLDLFLGQDTGVLNVLYKNNGNGTFTDAVAEAGLSDALKGQGAGFADIDADGDLDLYVVNQSPNRLFENTGNSNRWLHVKLTGTVNNKKGIGARVTAVTGAVRQRRDVDGGSGFLSQPDLPVSFGFGATTTVDSVIVVWPNGVVNTQTSVSTNQVLTLGENSAPVATAQTATGLEDQDLTITLAGTDADANALTMKITTLPTKGALYQTSDGTTRGAQITSVPTTVTDTSKRVIFAAGADSNGTGYTTFGFAVNDGIVESSAVTVTVDITAVNDVPTLSAISNPGSVSENVGVQTVNITGIGTGATNEVQTLTVTATSNRVGLIPNPTVTYTSPSATGTLTYTPVADSSGTATITVTVSDNGGTTNSGVDTFIRTFTVAVGSINDAPTLSAIADPSAILENAGVQTINLSGIGTGAGDEVQTLTVTATSNRVGLIPNPTVTYTSPSATGTLTYTPVADSSGTATVTVTVSDDGGTGSGGVDIVSRTFTVTVTAVNDAPTLSAISDPSAILEDAGIQTINLSGIGTGAGDEVQTLTVTTTSNRVGLIPNPTVTYTSPSATGTLTYTPVADSSGTATVTVTVSDDGGTGSGGVDIVSRTFTVTVTAVNDAPTLSAISDPSAILEDVGIQTINLTGIGTGAGDEVQTLTVTATSNRVGLIPNPTVTYTSPSATGTLTYTPVADSSGTATITVTVSDDGGTVNGGVDTVVRTFTVTVTDVNDAPTLSAISNPLPISEDAVLQTITLTGIGAGMPNEVQVLSVTALSSHPSLIPHPAVIYTSPSTTGTLTYTPVPDSSGTATITVTVSDNGGTANGGVDAFIRTIFITVTPAEDVPIATADIFTILEDTPTALDVLSNDRDPDGDAISINNIFSITGGTAQIVEKQVRFSPHNQFSGTGGFIYAIVDNKGHHHEANVTVTITAVPDAPITQSDKATINQGESVTISVLDNDTDVEGGVLTLVSVSTPGGGTVSVGSGGNVRYTPQATFSGQDAFTYIVSDPEGNTSEGTVTITVIRSNAPPVAVADEVELDPGTGISISVRDNDTDADGDALAVTGVQSAQNGQVALNSDGTVFYRPNKGFNGVDVFTYAIADGHGGIAEGTVTIMIKTPPGAPTAVNDVASTAEDASVTIGVLGNDSDGGEGGLQLSGVGTVGTGTVVVNEDGSVTYTPKANFFGEDKFSYTIQNAAGNTASATVTITVSGVNDPPEISQVPVQQGVENKVFELDLSTFAFDPDNTLQQLRWEVIEVFAPIVSAVVEGHILKATPGKEVSGVGSIKLVLIDRDGARAEGDVFIDFVKVNDPPVFVPGTFEPKGGATDIARNAVLTWQARDPDNTNLTYRVRIGSVANVLNTVGKNLSESRFVFQGNFGVTYFWQVVVTDGTHTVEGPLLSFTVRADTTPPVLSRVDAVDVGISSARLIWETSKAATSEVTFGILVDLLDGITVGVERVGQSHAVTLSGLKENTVYFYRATSIDMAGNRGESAILSFATLRAPDIRPPAFVLGPLVEGLGDSTASVRWGTDELATGFVQLTGNGDVREVGVSSPAQNQSVVFGGLKPSTQYRVVITVSDAAKNTVQSNEVSFATAATPDRTPPVFIKRPQVTVTHNSAHISMRVNEPARVKVRYGFEPGVLTQETIGNQGADLKVDLLDLIEGAGYAYEVTVTDNANNVLMDTGAFKTLRAPDLVAPIIIESPGVRGVSQTQATVNWKTDEQAFSRVIYDSLALSSSSFRTPLSSSSAFTHSHRLTGLVAGKSYTYQVVNIDAANNAATSSEGVFKTLTAPDLTPPVLTAQPVYTDVGFDRITVEWKTGEASSSEVTAALLETPAGKQATTNPLAPLFVIDPAAVTLHKMTVADMRVSSNYVVTIRSKDAAGNVLEVRLPDVKTLAVPDITPPKITSPPVVLQVTDNRAQIVWATDEPADGFVEIDSLADFSTSRTFGTTEPSLEHSVTITGLTGSKTYHYRVSSRDVKGNGPTTQPKDARTLVLTTLAAPDITKPFLVWGPSAVSPAQSSVQIQWATNEPSDSRVQYGLTETELTESIFDGALVQVHEMDLTGLLYNTIY